MFPPLKALPCFAGEIDNRMLAPGYRLYNAGITRWDGKMLMAYRVEQFDGHSQIAICELDADLRPKPSTVLALGGFEGADEEDPRIFTADGKLYLSFVEIVYPPNGNGITIQWIARLTFDGTWQAERIKLEYGANFHRNEKNWIFFDATVEKEKDKTLIGAIYHMAQGKVAMFRGDGRFIEEHIGSGVKNWPFGTLSGGTPAMKLTDGEEPTFLHFFHSRRPFAGRNAQYCMSAALFTAREPFVTTKLSRTPLVWGSEMNPAFVNNRSPTNNPLVIFPNGFVREEDGKFLVCLGVNDTYIAFVRFAFDELDLVSPHELPANLEPPARIVMNGSVKVKLKEKKLDGTPAQARAFNGVVVQPGDTVVLRQDDIDAAGAWNFERVPETNPTQQAEVAIA